MTKQGTSSTTPDPVESFDDSSHCLRTYDLNCSGALLAAGFELISVDKQNPRKALFVFRREDGIETTVEAYWSDRLKVKARTFADNVKALKNRLYSD